MVFTRKDRDFHGLIMLVYQRVSTIILSLSTKWMVMISLDFFPGLPYCQWGKGWIGDFLQYTIFTLGFQPPLKHNQNNGWKNITTIVYLRVLIIQIGSTIILMVVGSAGNTLLMQISTGFWHFGTPVKLNPSWPPPLSELVLTSGNTGGISWQMHGV